MSRRTNSAFSRLRQDYLRLKRDPVPFVTAEPLPSNILEWHYLVTGPPDSLYAGGQYHGKLLFPSEFPFKPPSIYMSTPNGRFMVDTRLCLSISDYHPDTWNPAWSVATILTGLLSFMLETASTLGSIETTEAKKRDLAVKSHAFNLKDKTFVELFPKEAKKAREVVREQQRRMSSARSSSDVPGALDRYRSQLMQNNNNENNNNEGYGRWIHDTFTNVLIIGSFAAFVLVVKYVVQSLTATNQ